MSSSSASSRVGAAASKDKPEYATASFLVTDAHKLLLVQACLNHRHIYNSPDFWIYVTAEVADQVDFLLEDAAGMMRGFMQARLDATRGRGEEDETVLGLALDEWAAYVRGETEQRDARKGKGKGKGKKRAVEESTEDGGAAQKRTRRTKAGPSNAVNDTAAEEAPPPTLPEAVAPANVEQSPAPSSAVFSTAPRRKPTPRRKQKEDPMAEVTNMMIGCVERLGDSVHESARIASRPTAIENRLRQLEDRYLAQHQLILDQQEFMRAQHEKLEEQLREWNAETHRMLALILERFSYR